MRKRNGAFGTLAAPMALLGFGLVAGNAEAAFIDGSISFSNNLDTLSASPTAIVSDLDNIDVRTPTGISTPVGDFLGTTNAAGSDFSIVPFAPGVVYIVDVGAKTHTFL